MAKSRDRADFLDLFRVWGGVHYRCHLLAVPAVDPRNDPRLFGRLQVLSADFMAFSHGSNDGQKFIGVFTLVLVLGGVLPEFHVSWGVILLCSLMMGIGTSVGGWRIIKTMGIRMVKLEPYHGFAAETGAAAVIEIASRLGIPLSTTHTISTSIMGARASQRLSAVRWGASANSSSPGS